VKIAKGLEFLSQAAQPPQFNPCFAISLFLVSFSLASVLQEQT